MPDSDTMRVVPTEGGYRLESPTGASLDLTMEEALALGQLARQIEHHVAEQRQQGTRLLPVFAPPIEDTVVGIDAHHTQVLLSFVHQGGYQTHYTLSFETSKRMRDALTKKIEQIETAQQNRRPQ